MGWGEKTSVRAAKALALTGVIVLGLLLAAPASAKVKRTFFGAATVVPPKPIELRGMVDTGVGVYRLPILWREVEPDAPQKPLLGGPARNQYTFQRYDAELRDLVQAGLDAHVVLSGTPSWVGPSIHTTPWRSAKGRRHWPRFVAAVVDRYGAGGSFWRDNPDLRRRPPIAYQIWNEQNSGFYYAPEANPVEYSRLYVAAAEQIRARDSRAEIVSGGMFATPQRNDSTNSWSFLKRFLKERGVADHLDAVGIHPYAGSLQGVKFQMKTFRRILRKRDMRRMPLQVTEIGWSSAMPDERTMFYQGLRGQAKLTKTSLKLLLNHVRRWKVERILWFTWRDINRRKARELGCNFCPRMGLLRGNLKPKPAYRKFAAKVRSARSGKRRKGHGRR